MNRPAPAPALVVVPTYNERDSIAELIDRLHAAAGGGADVLVVDDSSPDGTGRVVDELIEERPGFLSLLVRPAKRGLGGAYLDGFRWGLGHGYDALVEMDADLSHDPVDVVRLLAALEDADLVIGSRYVLGGAVVNWSIFRRVLSRGGNLYARVLLGFEVADATSGFRAYRASLLASVDLDAIRSEGYAFQVEMVRRAQAAGARIVEIPITFTERTHGRSKMSRAIVFEALVRITSWGLSDRLGRLGWPARRRR
jgi:dolichol-phosphate mannosyltransferase